MNGKWNIPEESLSYYFEQRKNKEKDSKQINSSAIKSKILQGHLTISKVAKTFNLSHSNIRTLIREGFLPDAKKVSGQWNIPEESLSFLYEHTKNVENESKHSISISSLRLNTFQDHLTTNEVAKKLNITPAGVKVLIKNGKLRDAIKHGKTWLIPESSLTEYKTQKEKIKLV
ncbi:helix-turn-helix domain-containing protein [Bacillus timonensis]|uniref:helix-turn-helix domain-containing protein n=1 Tax=Bacillus timonensis TaxID=1033734 RepID=UPI0002D339C7|nr:helix-turn-helix domain-containing protein [Bacillus timonensis]